MKQCVETMVISLKHMLGLVYDLVVGLAEIPCVKRIAIGAANPMSPAEISGAGSLVRKSKRCAVSNGSNCAIYIKRNWTGRVSGNTNRQKI
nr:L-serine ammonia-lyase, iron-sulfur-dependent, subunit alpha [uncultured Bacillus sp.]